MQKTWALAQGRWPMILARLAGLTDKQPNKRNQPCPLPGCGGKDRWRLTDLHGKGRWICSHCGSGDGYDLLLRLRGWGYQEASQAIERLLGTDPVPVKPQRQPDYGGLYRRVWGESRWFAESRYLRETRGLGDMLCPEVLRVHPRLEHIDANGLVTYHR